jgi:hypothetical protein
MEPDCPRHLSPEDHPSADLRLPAVSAAIHLVVRLMLAGGTAGTEAANFTDMLWEEIEDVVA